MTADSNLPCPGAFVLTVDVEEWYHTCLVPRFVRPASRPAGLTRELDHLLPRLLETLASFQASATFFVLGEVAYDLPARIREISAAGHEIASHSYHHLRVNDLSLGEFRRDAERSKKILEDLIGLPVQGFRAPEWSMRRRGNPRLGVLAELGFKYDSSLAPFLGAGALGNSTQWKWLEGADLGVPPSANHSLLELPPLSLAPWLRLPAGSWTGRKAPLGCLLSAGKRMLDRGGVPVMVVHPWELSGQPTPGSLPVLARFVHEVGREHYLRRFTRLLSVQPFGSIEKTLESKGLWR